jgi:hypothetical protein
LRFGLDADWKPGGARAGTPMLAARSAHREVVPATVATVALALVLTVGVGSVQARPPSKPAPSTPAPMTLAQESYSGPNSGSDTCLGVDDQLKWEVNGSLHPGESFTFTPERPLCRASENPYLNAKVTWDASQLRLSSVAPAISNTSSDDEQLGKPIVAPMLDREASLCMFTSPMSQSEPVIPYSFTVTNTGTQTANVVRMSGETTNGWPFYFYRRCFKADADGDGWSDSVEQVMSVLTYHGCGGVLDPYDACMGSNYLRSVGTDAADDQVDFYPPDLNDDNRVDQSDVDRVSAYLNQGTGYSIDMISPNPGDPNYLYKQAAGWRRADLNGDGYVTVADADIVRQLRGVAIPATDVFAPWVKLRSPLDDVTVAANSELSLKASAVDAVGYLRNVEVHVNGSLVVTLSGESLKASTEPRFTYTWQVPRKRGATYTVTFRATDAAGNTASDSILVTAR